MSETHPSAEVLIQHTGWLRALALRLVQDASRADDVVQRSLLQALRRPPRDPQALPAWLARVARNEAGQILRSERARVRREERVARPLRAARSTDDVVARAEIHQRVVDAVLALDEPFRTVVLLRYFDGMTPKAIASHLGWPAATVRSRLKRGLDRLRDTLDDVSGGDRRGWVFSLVALVDPKDLAKGGGPAAALAGGGALIVSTKTKVVAAVAVLFLLLAGVVVWQGWFRSDEGTDGDGPVVATLDRTPAEDPDDPHLEGRAEEPAPVPVPVEPAVPEPAPSPRATLRFTDDAGREIEAAEVRRRYAAAQLPLDALLVSEDVLAPTDMMAAALRRLTGSEEGRARVEWGTSEAGLLVDLEPGTWRLFLARPGAAPVLTDIFSVDADGDTTSVDVPLPLDVPGLRIRLVEAESGAPIAGARLVPYYELGDDLAFFEGPPVVTGPGGEARVPRREQEFAMPRSRGCSWWAVAPGRMAQVNPRASRFQADGVHEVKVPLNATIRGRAYRQDGTSATGLEVVLSRKGLRLSAVVAEDGSFTLTGVPAHRSSFDLYLLEDVANLQIGRAKARVRPGETSEVVIGEPADAHPRATITGRITAGGTPWEGAVVFGRTPGQSNDEGTMTQADAEGRYRLVVPAGKVTFGVWLGGADDFMIRGSAPLQLGADEERELDFDLPGGTLRVTILDAESGEPVKAALAYAAPQKRDVSSQRFPGYTYKAGSAASVDEEGTVLLRALVPGEPHELRVMASGYERFEQKDVQCSREGAAPVELTVRLQKQ